MVEHGLYVGTNAALAQGGATGAAGSARAQGQPDGVVTVDFPLLDDSPAAPQRLNAVVERWLPPPREGAAGDDLAGLLLVGEPTLLRPPRGANPARLVVNPPPIGRPVRVFGYPGIPPRPDGAWVPTAVRGRVGSGRLQLDSGADAALRVQPGFSGSPVYDDIAGRVVGLLASAAAGRSGDRDSYAISTDRLRLAWPEILDRRKPRTAATARGTGYTSPRITELTVLHVSDPQFGKNRIFGGNGLTQARRRRPGARRARGSGR